MPCVTPPPPLPHPLHAVLFDLDGTLVDSESLHMESANRMLKRLARPLSQEEFAPYIGWCEETFWADLKARFDLPGSPGELAELRTAEYLRILHSARIEPLPGVRQLLDHLVERGLPRAVASSSPRNQIDASLRSAGLHSYFTVRVSGHEDVARGKPAPDVYLAAAAALGVEPEHCLAIEDSPTGVAAARAAGAYVIAVPCPSHPAEDLSGAHRRLGTVNEIVPLIDR